MATLENHHRGGVDDAVQYAVQRAYQRGAIYAWRRTIFAVDAGGDPGLYDRAGL